MKKIQYSICNTNIKYQYKLKINKNNTDQALFIRKSSKESD